MMESQRCWSYVLFCSALKFCKSKVRCSAVQWWKELQSSGLSDCVDRRVNTPRHLTQRMEEVETHKRVMTVWLMTLPWSNFLFVSLFFSSPRPHPTVFIFYFEKAGFAHLLKVYTVTPLFQEAEWLPWHWLSCHHCSALKVEVVEVVVELEEEDVVVRDGEYSVSCRWVEGEGARQLAGAGLHALEGQQAKRRRSVCREEEYRSQGLSAAARSLPSLFLRHPPSTCPDFSDNSSHLSREAAEGTVCIACA